MHPICKMIDPTSFLLSMKCSYLGNNICRCCKVTEMSVFQKTITPLILTQFMVRSRLRIRATNIHIRPSLSWDLHPFSFPCLSAFLKSLVYHPAALISLTQAHTCHLISLIFFSILSSFLRFHPQMRCHVHFPTDSSHHDCFFPQLQFSIKPEGQEANAHLKPKSPLPVRTKHHHCGKEMGCEQKMTPCTGQMAFHHFATLSSVQSLS